MRLRTFPRRYTEAGGDGFARVIFPEEYGGAGTWLHRVCHCRVEELSRVDGSVGIIVAAHNSLCSNHISKFGNSEEQKKKYLTPARAGEEDRSVVADRAGGRIGRWRDAGAPRCAEWEALGFERCEDLHHQWALCRCLRGPWRGHRQSRRIHTAMAHLKPRKKEWRDSSRGRKKISWGCGLAIRRRLFSPIVAYRRRICLGRRARDLSEA